MGKPTICIGENKGADQLRSTAKLISAFVFATRLVQFLFYVYPKFQASSTFLCLCSSVCVGPVQKPHCWFSHEAAHFNFFFTCLFQSTASFWQTWKEFEIKHGNEDTVREMLRIKRSVQAMYNTQVNFMSAQMLAVAGGAKADNPGTR